MACGQADKRIDAAHPFIRWRIRCPFDISPCVTYNLSGVYDGMDETLQAVAELLTNLIALAYHPRSKRV